MRIGQGFDLHKLIENRPLLLGGIKIDSLKGELAHSDGDVLIHALIDALLGATGSKDIGTLFPDTDIKYKNIASTELLKQTLKKIAYKKLINIDCTIILEEPKLSPYIDKIRENLSSLLKLPQSNISIKAKTSEGLLQNAIIAQVVLLLEE